MATLNLGAADLRAAMKEEELSDAYVARLCEVSESTVRDWKTSYHRPSPPAQARLYRRLGIWMERWYEAAPTVAEPAAVEREREAVGA